MYVLKKNEWQTSSRWMACRFVCICYIYIFSFVHTSCSGKQRYKTNRVMCVLNEITKNARDARKTCRRCRGNSLKPYHISHRDPAILHGRCNVESRLLNQSFSNIYIIYCSIANISLIHHHRKSWLKIAYISTFFSKSNYSLPLRQLTI